MVGAKTADATPNTGNRSLDRPRIVASRDCWATNAKTIDCWKACSYSTRAMSVKSPTRLGDIGLYRKARKILKEVPVAPDRWTYSDLALPGNDENDRLDIFTRPREARAALARKRHDDMLRAGRGRVPSVAAAD